ncbi:hypothetical protein C8R44DRAFT_890638 [Mycena epipterygia]|nr:hypothetical protein C8R44DRAFT_890638 [Mycena epipterygia]
MKHLEALTADNMEIFRSARVMKSEEGVSVVDVESEPTASGNVVAAHSSISSLPEPRGLLAQQRPNLLALATTNAGPMGDGRLATALVQPADLCDIDQFLAAEALRRVGGQLLDAHEASAS